MQAPGELQAALLAGLLAQDETAVAALLSGMPSHAMQSLQQLLPASLATPLAAGDAATACRRRAHPRWLLLLDSQLLLRAVLQRLESSRSGTLPLGFDLAAVLIAAAAQAGDARALRHFAAALPPGPGRLPAEYRRLAEDVVAAAHVHDCCASADPCQDSMLRCLADLSDLSAADARRAPSCLAPYLSAPLEACMEGAAQEGRLSELRSLLAAGLPVTPGALRAAIEGGSPAALGLLLRHGAPPPEPVLLLPAEGGRPARYACPVLTLLAAHAAQVRFGRGPGSRGVGQAPRLASSACLPAHLCAVVPMPLSGSCAAHLIAPLLSHRATTRCTQTAWPWLSSWRRLATAPPRSARPWRRGQRGRARMRWRH